MNEIERSHVTIEEGNVSVCYVFCYYQGESRGVDIGHFIYCDTGKCEQSRAETRPD